MIVPVRRNSYDIIEVALRSLGVSQSSELARHSWMNGELVG